MAEGIRDLKQTRVSRARKKAIGGISTKGATTPRGSGLERLRREADKQVGRDARKLAVALMKKALKGDVKSTKALMDLAKMKSADPVEELPYRSLAAEWAAEPLWTGPVPS